MSTAYRKLQTVSMVLVDFLIITLFFLYALGILICLIPRHPPGVVQTRNISDIAIINSSIHASTFAELKKYGHGGIQGGILYNSNR